MQKKLSVLSLVLVLILVFSLTSAAQEVTIQLGWAETDDPMGHQASAGVHVFKNYVESQSAGEIKVELYPAAQLGDAASMLDQVKNGVIEAVVSVPSGLLAGRYSPNTNIFDIPYLFDNNLVAWKTLNPETEFFQDFSDSVAENTNLRLLAFFIEGARHFTNDVREIRSPEDMEGLSIRTMEVPAHEIMVKSLGASPTPIAWTELYSALDTGVVDGQENPLSNIEYLSAYEVQDYLTLDGHITLLNTLIINDQFYQGLSEEHKKIVDQGGMMAAMTNRGMSEVLDVVAMRVLEEEGMQIAKLTPEELAAFRETTQPPVIEFIREEVDDEAWVDRILEEVEKVRQELQ